MECSQQADSKDRSKALTMFKWHQVRVLSIDLTAAKYCIELIRGNYAISYEILGQILSYATQNLPNTRSLIIEALRKVKIEANEDFKVRFSTSSDCRSGTVFKFPSA